MEGRWDFRNFRDAEWYYEKPGGGWVSEIIPMFKIFCNDFSYLVLENGSYCVYLTVNMHI